MDKEKDEILLKPCPLCGRPAVKTEEHKKMRGLVLVTTIIRCEGKTYKTSNIKGCNVRCSASGAGVAEAMWNKRSKEKTK